MTPLEERNRWIRAGLETHFTVLEKDDPQNSISEGFPVMDAECEVVCVCPTREFAELIAEALDDYARAMWKIAPEENGTDSGSKTEPSTP